MSHGGDCYDEVPMANFWRILEHELVRHRCYATRERGPTRDLRVDQNFPQPPVVPFQARESYVGQLLGRRR